MSSEAFETLCAVCEEPTSVAERAFPFGEETLLCFRCALDRGGLYDETLDRWVRPPKVEDLLATPS